MSAKGDQFRVHYAGFADSWDETVTADRIRPFQPKHFEKGTAVDIWSSTDKKWYPGKVLRSWYGLTFVHYDGWSKEWNEWVNFDSIRLPGHAK
ncbi:MAG TPA: agenet domain-containing protein [Planctomycetaceae bacterium]|nr:agenet domain-containing protein [Planctomycetaceae bacterium]